MTRFSWLELGGRLGSPIAFFLVPSLVTVTVMMIVGTPRETKSARKFPANQTKVEWGVLIKYDVATLKLEKNRLRQEFLDMACEKDADTRELRLLLRNVETVEEDLCLKRRIQLAADFLTKHMPNSDEWNKFGRQCALERGCLRDARRAYLREMTGNSVERRNYTALFELNVMMRHHWRVTDLLDTDMREIEDGLRILYGYRPFPVLRMRGYRFNC